MSIDTTADPVLSRLDELVATLAEALDATAGRSLVDALADQFAAGQVETLLSLHTAGSAVRTGTTRLDERLSALERALAQIAATTTAVGSAATTAAATLATTVTDDVASRLITITETVVAGSKGAAQQALDGLADETAADVRARVSPITAQLDDATAALSLQVAAGTQSVVTHLRHTEEALAQVAGHAVERTDAAAQEIAGVVDRLETAVDAAVVRLLESGNDIAIELQRRTDDLEQRATEAATLITKALTAKERRDDATSARLEKRVDDLVARTDAKVDALISALAAQTDRLAARDAELEAQRADEFARVLTDAAGSPVAGRRLRKQVAAVTESRRP